MSFLQRRQALLGPFSGAVGPSNFVGVSNNYQASGSPFSITPSPTPVAGNLGLLVVGAGDASPTVTGWTNLVAGVQEGCACGPDYVGLWYKNGSLTSTVTVSDANASGVLDLIYMEASGQTGAPTVLLNTTTTSAGSQNFTSSSAATAGKTVIGIMINPSSSNAQIASGFTTNTTSTHTYLGPASNNQDGIGYQVDAAVATSSATVTWNVHPGSTSVDTTHILIVQVN